MATARLELSIGFCAAHRVDSLRAGCPGLHGHNFRLRAAFVGEIDAVSGTVVDSVRAQRVLHETVFLTLDHGLLNDRIENPTLERVAHHVFRALEAQLPELAEVSLEDGSGRLAVVRKC